MRLSAFRLELNRAAAKLHDPLAGILEVRHQTPKSAYSDIIRAVRGTYEEKLRRRLIRDARPRPPFYFKSQYLESELRWARLYLRLFSEELSIYVRCRAALERATLSSNGPAAVDALENIENVLGSSSWLVRQRISSLQFFEGVDAQKGYARNLQLSGSMIDIVANFASGRAEESVSLTRFSSQFRSTLDDWSLPEPFRIYLEEHLLPSFDTDRRRLLIFLGCENSGPIVDHYEAILRVCRYLTGSIRKGEASQSERIEVTAFLAALEQAVGDFRLRRMLFEIEASTGGNEASAIVVEPLVPFERLLEGDHDQAELHSRDELSQNPTLFGNIEVAARALAASPNPPIDEDAETLVDALIRGLADVFAKGEGSQATVAWLLKTACIYFDFGWGAALAGAVLRQELSQNANFAHSPAPSAGTHASIMFLSELHPVFLARVQTSAVRTAYASKIEAVGPGSLASAYAARLAGEKDVDLTRMLPEERALLNATSSFVNSDFSATIEFTKSLTASDQPRYVQAGYRLKAWSLLHTGLIDDCLALIVKVLSVYPERWASFPLAVVAAMAAEAPGGSPLDRAILFDLHSRYVDDRFQLNQIWSLEDLLIEVDITRPSELQFDHVGDRDGLIRLLRSVCHEEALGHLLTLPDTTAAVERERVEILKSLAKIDSGRAAEYGMEQARIIQQIDHQEHQREIERSRVNVDLEGVRKEVQRLSESYGQFVEFLEEQEGAPNRSSIRTADPNDLRILVLSPEETGGEMLILRLGLSELDSLLMYIIKAIRDEYTSNTRHGLDGYLSMRIRHGTLLGALRSPVEQHFLITQRDSETGLYKENDYWEARIPGAAYDRVKFAEATEQFSRGYDGFVERITTKWVQIRRSSEEKDLFDEGLFDFRVSRNDVRTFRRQLGSDPPPFEEFVGKVFDFLHGKLERSLQSMREALGDEAKREATSLLNQLQELVEDIVPEHFAGELLNEIKNTRTTVLDTLTAIIRWFDSPGEDEIGTFKLSDALRLAEASIPEFSVDFNDSDAITLRGSFPSCFDIFYNVFDNASKRAGTAGPVVANTSILCHDEAVTVIVTNAVGEEACSPEAYERVDNIRKNLEEDTHSGRAAQEGGTGLYKIYNALQRDFAPASGGKPRLEFSFEQGPSFCVRLEFPITLVEQDEKDPPGGQQ